MRKAKNVKVPPTRVFNYTSECCEEGARKPPVERSDSDRSENKFSECGLGTWTCSKCGKKCKVKRTRISQLEATGVND